MKRLFLLLIFLTLCFFANGQMILSVLYFENTTRNEEYNWLSKALTDMIITDISASLDLQVIEREEIETIISEQEKSNTDIYSDESAIKLGNLLNCTSVLYGSFIIFQQSIRIDAKLVDIETGKILNTAQATGEMQKFFLIQKNLTVNLLVAMAVDIPDTIDYFETQSLRAAEEYYTGLDFLDQGQYENAAQHFREASQLDPFYIKPQKSLEEAYQFLKDFRSMRYQREISKLYEQAAEIKMRLNADTWLTYGEFITQCYQKGLSQEEIDKLTKENPVYLMCDTRGQCTWELQHILLEIADKCEEYFNDTETGIIMYQEISNIAQQARQIFKDDPFLPEILYMELFSIQYFEKWEELMQACEYLMLNFPDYRMMWAIEDFYETALEELSAKQAR